MKRKSGLGVAERRDVGWRLWLRRDECCLAAQVAACHLSPPSPARLKPAHLGTCTVSLTHTQKRWESPMLQGRAWMWGPLDASIGTSACPRLRRQRLEVPFWASFSSPRAQRYISGTWVRMVLQGQKSFFIAGRLSLRSGLIRPGD